MSERGKRDGFAGERLLVLPPTVVSGTERNPLLAGLFPTDIGYFPGAAGHRRERPKGIDQAIFIYCTKGSGWCEIRGRRHAVHSGELLVIPPHVPHAYGASDKDPWSIHWFHVQGSSMGAFLKELEITIQHPVIHIGDDAQLLALFQDVLGGLEEGYQSSQLLYSSQTLAHLLGAIVRRYHEGRHEPSGIRQKIAQTVAYMEQHLDHPLSLKTLATMAGLGRSQYSALFKKQNGQSPIEYFIHLRMTRARHVLETTSASIKTVASSLGYDDPLYFSRVFRSIHGKSPQSCRKAKA